MPNPPARENGDLDGDLNRGAGTEHREQLNDLLHHLTLKRSAATLSGAGNALAVYRDTDAVSGDVPVTDGA